MRILVNHLTRMQPGYVCVAGIDLETRRHVRPVLPSARLTTQLLRRNGGPFDIGAVVDLGLTECVGQPPELEDHVFIPHHARHVRDATPDEFWDAIDHVCRRTLSGSFGDALKKQGRSRAMDEGTGRASLGCLLPTGRPALGVDLFNTVRLSLTDNGSSLFLLVTDLRLYEDDHKTPRRQRVAEVARRMQRGVHVILSVGLARAWQKPGDGASRHWLQVNNLHLSDDAV